MRNKLPEKTFAKTEESIGSLRSFSTISLRLFKLVDND